MRLTDFTTLTFDCYGTLIDWESGIVAALAPLAERDPSWTRREMLESHARHEARQQLQTPTRLYRDVLATVYRRLAEERGIPVGWDECVRYGESVGEWPAFPDSAEALRYLAGHYRLVILSNVDNRSFAASNARLGVEFDAVYTAEDIGSYKPADANFETMLGSLTWLGVEKHDVLHVAESLFHDHVPANRHGLRSCWIHRRHGQEGFGATSAPGETPDYDFRFTSLAELVQAHRAEAGG